MTSTADAVALHLSHCVPRSRTCCMALASAKAPHYTRTKVPHRQPLWFGRLQPAGLLLGQVFRRLDPSRAQCVHRELSVYMPPARLPEQVRHESSPEVVGLLVGQGFRWLLACPRVRGRGARCRCTPSIAWCTSGASRRHAELRSFAETVAEQSGQPEDNVGIRSTSSGRVSAESHPLPRVRCNWAGVRLRSVWS